jgi:hypothetical protein
METTLQSLSIRTHNLSLAHTVIYYYTTTKKCVYITFSFLM